MTTENQPPGYLASRAQKQPLTVGAYTAAAKKSFKTLSYLARHTITPDSNVSLPDPILPDSPAGVIRPKLLERIEQISEASKNRSLRLEQKSTATLSGLGIAAPLVVAIATYLARDPALSSTIRYFSLVLAVLAIASLSIAFVACLRALSIRQYDELGLGSIISNRTFRRHSTDFHGRGLLHTYVLRESVNDHVADFVRAAQMFLVMAVGLVMLAGLISVSAIATSSTNDKKPSAPERALSEMNESLKLISLQLAETQDLRNGLQQTELKLAAVRGQLAVLSEFVEANSKAAHVANETSTQNTDAQLPPQESVNGQKP